ncbi:MAG: hypothetical protein UZ10_BCD003002122 [Bacteroidetes bacterium OLB10]|nr:MAG: hypothetical protein UZ10_BCD003002122 [Bacteroidetes bacterium OLB10]
MLLCMHFFSDSDNSETVFNRVFIKAVSFDIRAENTFFKIASDACSTVACEIMKAINSNFFIYANVDKELLIRVKIHLPSLTKFWHYET